MREISMMREITQEELDELVKKHKLWLDTSGEEGERLVLKDVCIYGANLIKADLRKAVFEHVDLINAQLSEAVLTESYFRYVDLDCSCLTYAELINIHMECVTMNRCDLDNSYLIKSHLVAVFLCNSSLINSNLSNSCLCSVTLMSVDLTGADLYNSTLDFCTLEDTILDKKYEYRKGLILKEPMIGYKKCCINNGKKVIVTLEIPKGAIVFCINGKKCRTNIAKCINISDENTIAYSEYDEDFSYEVGKTYEIEDFDLKYNVECASGIHFFRTKEEAENY